MLCPRPRSRSLSPSLRAPPPEVAMPLYVQNGKLLNKTGTLGTSVGCCCGSCVTGCCSTSLPSTCTLVVSNVDRGTWQFGGPPVAAGTYTLNRSGCTYSYSNEFYSLSITRIAKCDTSANAFAYRIEVIYRSGISGNFVTFDGNGVSHLDSEGCSPSETFSLSQAARWDGLECLGGPCAWSATFAIS